MSFRKEESVPLRMSEEGKKQETVLRVEVSIKKPNLFLISLFFSFAFFSVKKDDIFIYRGETSLIVISHPFPHSLSHLITCSLH